MMNNKMDLRNKNAKTMMFLAKKLLTIEVGERMPTFVEMAEELGFARGTVQNAIKELLKNHVIQMQSRGYLGSFLVEKDVSALIKLAGYDSLIGVTCIPFTPHNHALNTALMHEINRQQRLVVHLHFQDEWEKWMIGLKEHQYDFVMLDRYSYQKFVEQKMPIQLICDLGAYTYSTDYVGLFTVKSKVVDQMVFGVLKDRPVQAYYLDVLAENKQVRRKEFDVFSLLQAIKTHTIDVTALPKEIVDFELLDVIQKPIEPILDLTHACLICASDRPEIAYIMKHMLDVQKFQQTVQLVLGKQIPLKY